MRTSLEKFISKHGGQANAAKLLGVSAPAIFKALACGRSIFVTENPDGSFRAEEMRPFPSQQVKRSGSGDAA